MISIYLRTSCFLLKLHGCSNLFWLLNSPINLIFVSGYVLLWILIGFFQFPIYGCYEKVISNILLSTPMCQIYREKALPLCCQSVSRSAWESSSRKWSLVMQKYAICSIEVGMWKMLLFFGFSKVWECFIQPSKKKKRWQCINDEIEILFIHVPQSSVGILM